MHTRSDPTPVWSVMIPTYCPREDYLKETIDSVLIQAQPPVRMQIEVVDDRSPDVDVAALVRRVAGERVQVYQNPVNKGLAGCWNTCIQRARGQFVHILHQDDLIRPGFYEALECGFRSGDEIGAAFCRHAFVDQDGHWSMLSDLEARDPGVLPDFLQRISSATVVQCPSIAVRRSVYDKVGLFRTDHPHTLDWEMWVRIATQYPVFYEPKILACYRIHENSMTSRQVRSGEQMIDIFRALKSFSHHLDPRTARRSRRAYAERGLNTVRQLIRGHELDAAIRNLKIVLLNCAHPTIWIHPAIWLTACKMLLKLQLARFSQARAKLNP